uniref:Putative conserved secreted protein synganglion overexpressed n=1 Tax=Rhipicephalus microplus TaxID=6941 RepID=A0A6M2D3E1_RHIMP
MHSLATRACLTALFTTAYALPLNEKASPSTPWPDACPEPYVRESEAFLREIVSRLESILPDSIPVPDVSCQEYTLFNGTLSPLHLTDVNVIVEEATCQKSERHFPFTISVSKMDGTYEYIHRGSNDTEPEDRGHVGVTFSGAYMRGTLSQKMQAASGDGNGVTLTRPEFWPMRITLGNFMSYPNIRSYPMKRQSSAAMYGQMKWAAKRTFYPLFIWLPETHVLPALRQAYGGRLIAHVGKKIADVTAPQ